MEHAQPELKGLEALALLTVQPTELSHALHASTNSELSISHWTVGSHSQVSKLSCHEEPTSRSEAPSGQAKIFADFSEQNEACEV